MRTFKERDNGFTFEPSMITWEEYNAPLFQISLFFNMQTYDHTS